MTAVGFVLMLTGLASFWTFLVLEDEWKIPALGRVVDASAAVTAFGFVLFALGVSLWLGAWLWAVAP